MDAVVGSNTSVKLDQNQSTNVVQDIVQCASTVPSSSAIRAITAPHKNVFLQAALSPCCKQLFSLAQSCAVDARTTRIGDKSVCSPDNYQRRAQRSIREVLRTVTFAELVVITVLVNILSDVLRFHEQKLHCA